ncbi:MAG TPA: hypothetical protein VMD97_11675 [Candidatus Aquilonibacter sp.]|nr:hypothetical protein [Candidatus Aquilonibacter sp.]
MEPDIVPFCCCRIDRLWPNSTLVRMLVFTAITSQSFGSGEWRRDSVIRNANDRASEMTLSSYAQSIGDEKRNAGEKVALLVLEGGKAA